MVEIAIFKSIACKRDGAKQYFVSLLVASLGLVALAPSAYADSTYDLQNSAIAAIQEADAAGADTRELVDRLNLALEQATSPTAGSCISPQECTDTLRQSFLTIAHDANNLRDQAIRNSYIQLAVSQIFGIIGAFIAAFTALLLYRYRDSIQMKKDLLKTSQNESR